MLSDSSNSETLSLVLAIKIPGATPVPLLPVLFRILPDYNEINQESVFIPCHP